MKGLVLFLMLAFSMALAESLPYTHDGFFLNLSLGFGGQSAEYEGNGFLNNSSVSAEGDASGMTFEFDWKIGGRILPFTLFHATVIQVHSLDGFELEAKSNARNASVEGSEYMGLIGAGITYYLPPYNFFFTGSLGFARFIIGDYGTDFGFGLQLGVGKEWWVSENWGLGVMATIVYGSADDGDYGEFSTLAFNIMISTTFN